MVGGGRKREQYGVQCWARQEFKTKKYIRSVIDLSLSFTLSQGVINNRQYIYNYI